MWGCWSGSTVVVELEETVPVEVPLEEALKETVEVAVLQVARDLT